MDQFAKEYKTDFAFLEGYQTMYEQGHHPFMIGLKHFPEDGGMYIRPEQAPCYQCHKDYTDPVHKGEKSAVVQLTRDCQEKEIGMWLSGLKPDMAELGIEGFAFKTNGFHVLREGQAII